MAVVSTSRLAALLNGIVQNVTLWNETVEFEGIWLGNSAEGVEDGTELTKLVLNNLLTDSHASGSDNQTITAGAGLTGGGSGASVTVDVGAGTGMTVNADDIAIDFGVAGSKAISATDLAATTNAKGAALIGIEDAAGQFTGTTVEAGLTESLDAAQAAQATADAAIPSSEKGAANGVATLDGSGLLPVAQLPISAMTFDGNYNASTNSPTLANTDTGEQGTTYRVNVAGSQDFGAGSITFEIGDWVYNTGTTWEKGDNIDQVTSVAGKTGAVTLDTDDVTEATNLYFTDTRAKTAAVLNTLAGSETDQAPSVSAVNAALAAQNEASEITYSNATSGLAATDTQAAIDEVEARVDTIESSGIGAVIKSFTAGQAFSINTTYTVRMAVSGETDGRVYAVGTTAALGHPIGAFRPTSAITAGTSVNITLLGEITSSTAFTAAQDEGKPVFADASGNPTLTAPTSGANIQIGSVSLVGAAGTAKILVQSPRLVGMA